MGLALGAVNKVVALLGHFVGVSGVAHVDVCKVDVDGFLERCEIARKITFN